MSHQSFFKENQGECGCGCGEFGTLKAEWRDGTRCVQRKCKCRRCMGRQNRSLAKQRKAAIGLGLATSKFLPSDEEAMAGAWRMECKSGKRDAGPVWTAFVNSEAQSEAARPVGDVRPFAAVFMPPGQGSDGLVVVRLSTWQTYVAPAIDEFNGVAS